MDVVAIQAAKADAAAKYGPLGPAVASLEPYRDQRPAGSLRRQDLRRVLYETLDAVLAGTLTTKKAKQTGKSIRWAATAAATQTLPRYDQINSGLGGDNAAYIADKGWLNAAADVTAVYNLTADPTRATNRLNTVFRATQQISVTATPTAGDTMEAVMSYSPYQGCLDTYSPPVTSAVTNITFEVVHFDNEGTVTTSGFAGAGNGSASPIIPVAPKLPLGSGFTGNSFRDTEEIEWTGASGDTVAAWIQERVPVRQSGDASSTSFARLREGSTYTVATVNTGTGRGYQQLSPLVKMLGPKLTTVPTVNGYLAYIAALVRVSDMGVSGDDGVWEMGNVFLMLCTRGHNASTTALTFGASSDTTSAVDLYVPLGGPVAYFDGFKGLR